MDEVDIDNVDDLNELEARLYAQVHHEAYDGDNDISATYEEASPIRQVTSTSIINKSYDRTRGRYWNEKINFRNNTPPAKPKQPSTSSDVGQLNKEKQNVSGGSREIKEKPVETVDKTFQPPVKNLSNLRVNPFASGNGPKQKGSSTNPRNKNTTADKSKRIELREPNKGPFGRQQTKLAHAMKYDGKKQKAKAAKAKMRKNDAAAAIELSGSETDDVIEVPVPSPKIVTIDTSSDEETAATATEQSGSFVKPEAVTVKENSSRCTSPCSVVSDEFIGHNDRSRLLEESGMADDEDLLMLQVDVDSLMEAPERSTDKSSESFATPTRERTEKIPPDYVVTQTNFRALDVYESESDIQESVYSKGQKPPKPSVVVNLDHETSSDDVEEIDITQKTKRLKKRRSSSANKDTDTIIDSTDSEQENEAEPRKNLEVQLTKVPHIAFGEAIPRMVTEEELLNQAVYNSSDNEFVANLSTLAQGASSTVAPDDSDEEEPEPITARSIAEKVLSKNRAVEKTTTPTATTTRTTVSPEPVIAHDEEANDAIPHDSLAELNHIFNKIDNMDNKAPDNADTDDSDQSVELVAPLPVIYTNKPSQKKMKMQKDTGDPVYNVVYSEHSKVIGGGGIGWCEEMRKFYNDSWKGERFSVKAVCSQMKNTKTLWKIYTDDRFPKYRRHSHQKCMNCCEFGHIRSKCPKPRKVPVCYMCGEKGHSEPRCPNTICLRCGNKTRMFTKSCNACNYQNRLICPICKVRGHSLNLCPDKWRRYHSTTKPNEYPNNKVEYKNKKLCCICGQRGHLSEHCSHAIHFSEYPTFVSTIRSHQKSYDDISIKTIRSGIGYNLMYKPDEDISFELAENKTRYQYYGRFLVAVGMGYMLTRKRRVENKQEDETPVKQKKVNTDLKDYVVNPFAKAALEKSPAKPKAIESVQQVDEEETSTESPAKEPASTVEPITIDEEDAYEIEPSTSKGIIHQTSREETVTEQINSTANTSAKNATSTFKTPDSTSPGIASKKTQEAADVVDSDSNYSFSEHFEPNQHQSNPSTAREMDPLPDFIPIVDDEDMEEDEPEESINVGISKKFVSLETDEDEENTSELPDLPCEAKIYLTTFHSKFLLSPDGNSFLVEKSKAFDIKARLEWTSVGHILIIYGLRCNQDKFHIELLHKFRELSEKMNRNQLEKSQKVPRKTEVLIRFLRENLNQLLTNLGNPNELYKRLIYQEKLQTKTGWKSAEKTRRLLNMILIGQAGLRNGSIHLDHLLSHLRILIDECKDEVVSNEVRDEIDSHWRFIFSSQRHEKYPELLEAYNHMQVKNRFQNINIDPRLLGKKMLDTTLTKAQKDKMDKAVDVNTLSAAGGLDKMNSPAKLVPNPLAVRTPNRPPKTPVSEKKRQKNVSSNSSAVAQKTPNQQNQKETTNHVANKIKAVNVEWEAKCANLLSEIDETKKRGGQLRNTKESSTFWSREALKYIDECMELGKSNLSFLEKLSRVQIKSQKGLLSYNDYRAIIKIHNAIKSKQ
ncbi:uncharacterized protein LOC129908158 [Episyrphus balteatus]|uniref:uncharacterized protein LOC129908158 n=1 Tax=Episyrphus balteatus TaxID=286459 RepID=UPI0024863FB3|nr:uncharacterized protein LOC129908158 [Episyrphus balteatus]